MNTTRILEWCDRIVFYSLLSAAFFISISTAGVEISATVGIISYLLRKIILIVRALHASISPRLFLRESFSRSIATENFLFWPALVFVYATLLSVIASQFPHLSWRGFFGKTLEAVFLFFMIVESINSRRRLNFFLGALILSALVVTVDGIGQYFLRFGLFFSKPITVEGRITGPFGHPNDYGSYLSIMAVFCFSLLTWAWNSRKSVERSSDFFIKGLGRFIVLLFVSLLCVVALGWTFSRGAWIGFGCAMCVLIVLSGKRWYFPFFLLIVFGITFYSQLESVRNVSFITDDISMQERHKVKRLAAEKVTGEQKTEFENYWEDVSSALSSFNWTGRQVFWGEAIEVFKAAPFFGTGLNTYTAAVQRYNSSWTQHYSHNCYLQMLAEIGIAGLSVFLWIMWVMSHQVWRVYWQMPDGFYRVVLGGLYSGLVGFWIHGAMDTNFYSSRLSNFMWILIGLIVAVILLGRQRPSSYNS